MRKIFTVHTFSVAEKVARSSCFLPGIPFISPHDFCTFRPDSDILTGPIIKTSEENSHRYSPPPEMA